MSTSSDFPRYRIPFTSVTPPGVPVSDVSTNQAIIPPSSPIRGSRSNRTSSPPPNLYALRRSNKRDSTSPCCTPTNSPERNRGSQSSPSGHASRSHRSFQVTGSDGSRLRGPESPPTPYSLGSREIGRGSRNFGRPLVGISNLNLDLTKAERIGLEMSAATFAEGGFGTGSDDNTPRLFGSWEERQRRQRELNRVRIRNWEKFYGNMDGQREGGGVKCHDVVGFGERSGRPQGTVGGGDEERDDKEVNDGNDPETMLVPVKFIVNQGKSVYRGSGEKEMTK